MEMLSYRIGILMLWFSFSLFASFVQVPVFAQQEFPPPPPPPQLVQSPPPPLLSPPPPPLVEAPSPPIVPPPPPPVWTLLPPAPIWTSPPLATMQRSHQPPNRRKSRRKPPPKQHKLNSRKKVGLLFIAIAGTLQLFVAGILIFLRSQMLKVKDICENVE